MKIVLNKCIVHKFISKLRPDWWEDLYWVLIIKILWTHNKRLISIILSQLKFYSYTFVNLQFLIMHVCENCYLRALFPFYYLTEGDDKGK